MRRPSRAPPPRRAERSRPPRRAVAVWALASGLLALAACAAPTRELPAERPPRDALPGAASPLAAARAAWARRPDPAAVREADRLFLEAAAAAPSAEEAVAALAGAAAAELRLVDLATGGERGGLAARAVEAGERCRRRSPGDARCAYALALALGVQARERPATVRRGLALMAEELRRAAAADPRLDEGGPHRVLALLLVRAPGWPVGPGDPDAGLGEARAAAALFPAYAPNQLALAEALAATGDAAAAQAAAGRAEALARAATGAGEPDAPGWLAEARRLTGGVPPRR